LSEIQNAEIEWLDDGTPFSRQFNDIYFSSQGGLAESAHVFINGNNLTTRWQERRNSTTSFFIAELGFGTGLNFLLCWQLLEKLSIENLQLHYLAFEKHPLSMEDLRKAHALWPELEKYSSQFLEMAIDHTAGLHRLCLSPEVTLDLYYGDALEGMSELFPDCAATVDCWFMDGFAPAKNPDLWNESIARRMWHQSRHGTTVSTYSVAGQLRRNLQDVGFRLDRAPGFGSKRDMLLARKELPANVPETGTPVLTEHSTSWHRTNSREPSRNEAVVIGAGLAGCSTAYNLARKGWQVTLVDSAADIATGASGNRQGVLQPRLSAERSTQSRFYLHALLYAHRQFNQLQRIRDLGWHSGGIIRIPENDRPGLRKLLLNPEDYYNHNVLTALTAQQASEEAGLTLSADALYLPHGGWLRPAELCRTYLECITPANLQLINHEEVTELRRINNQWQIISGDRVIIEAPVAVLSNSYLVKSLSQTSFLPVVPVRGQLTQASCNANSCNLSKVVITGKYICPADNGSHSIGASYQSKTTDTRISAEEDRDNLQGIQGAFASPEQLKLTADGSRSSVRCNALDYFPIVGAVPDYHDFIKVFAPLQRNADATIDQTGNYHPGLYVNSAHGSYGLASCPLSAEYLASLISGQCLPLPAAMAASLSPTRFIIRALKKQQVKFGEQEPRDLLPQ